MKTALQHFIIPSLNGGPLGYSHIIYLVKCEVLSIRCIQTGVLPKSISTWYPWVKRRFLSQVFGDVHCMPIMSLQLCWTVCDTMDSTSPVSSVHGILQSRILEWVVIPFSRGSSQPRDGYTTYRHWCSFLEVKSTSEWYPEANSEFLAPTLLHSQLLEIHPDLHWVAPGFVSPGLFLQGYRSQPHLLDSLMSAESREALCRGTATLFWVQEASSLFSVFRFLL